MYQTLYDPEIHHDVTKDQTQSFWTQLDRDIDLIGKRTKQNLKKHQNRRAPERVKYDHELEGYTFSTIPTSHLSRNQIESKIKEQKELEQTISNRIKYLEEERTKHNKALSLAKKKFEKIIEIRTQTLKEKQYVKKKLKQINEEAISQVSKKAGKVKSQRSNTSFSINRLRRSLILEAERVRKSSLSHHQVIQKQKKAQLQQKKEKVHYIHSSLQVSRDRINSISISKMQKHRSIHRDQLIKKQKFADFQRNKNRILLTQLKKQIKLIHEQTNKSQVQLNNYGQILGLGSKRKHREKNSSFYLTNHD